VEREQKRKEKRRMKMSKLAFIVLLLSMSLAFNIQPVKSDWTWTETIYIRADGSVDPDTAPISTVDNITYTLTDNIVGDISEWSSAIVVERDNIVVDGAGYTLQGTGSARDHSIVIGMNLTGRINVTIKNMEIKTFRYGIRLSYSLNYNNITGNDITDNYIGIYIYESSNNTISRNNITDNYWYGINLGGSNNTISGNNVANNALPSNSWGGGIKLGGFNNTFIGNTIINNYGYGIYLESSSNNTLRNNSASNNKYNFGVYGSELFSHYIHDIDDSNTVNGKPMYYWVNRRDVAVPLDAGYVALINCTSITVKNLDLTSNARGVLMVYTINSTITKNNIANNIDSILGVQSHCNIISGNNIGNNSWYCYYPSGYGIDLNGSNNNTISGNNIVNNWNGIDLNGSNNTVNGNNITNNRDGVWIYRSSNTVSGNTITNNRYGILL
jgi:parallel beta-helix repeat protein